MDDRILLVSDAFARAHCLPAEIFDRLERLGKVTHVPHEDGSDVLGALADSSALLVAGWDVRLPWLDGAALRDCRDLSFIGCGQDGRWRFLDVPAALELGITCCDSTGAMGEGVAEFALGLVLCCLRDLARQHQVMAAGGWPDAWQEGPYGTSLMLRNRSVGIVGMGAIGKSLVRLLRPFGCPISVWSSYLDDAMAAALGVRRASITELTATSDVLIVGTQPRADTARILDARSIERLRPGSLVILAGRAATVDMEALYGRVLAGDLWLGIDVYEEEPLATDHAIRGHPHVVHTPHLAGRSYEANREITRELVADFERLRAGVPPRWATTSERALRARGR
jgi:phosphoglycerate dehydrogenase-like enzyme